MAAVILDLICKWNFDLSVSLSTSIQNVITSTRVLISPYPDQEGNNRQRPNSNFSKPLKKISERCPSNQVSAAAMTCASDEKRRLFNFFQPGWAKDLSAPLYKRNFYAETWKGCTCLSLT